MRIFKIVVAALYPNICVGCGKIIPEGEQLCEYCAEMIKKVDFTKSCRRCGMLKKECMCSKRVFHFSGCAAPYYNDGVAQAAMYSLKFARKEYIAQFFAERMAITVKTCFSDINFDFMTFVPMSFGKKLKRGFNQSEFLANRLSKILSIPLCDNLLLAGRKSSIQHKLNFDERFKNARGKFKANKKYNLNGKTVLLVDDIKTTGATLDECAKQLILLGADEVYCITGLMTTKKKKEGK